MKLHFYKYQGAGNDFVMIDNRTLAFPKENNKLVEQLCDRRFGVGADGLILLEPSDSYDFTMVYYNADGNESSMCGNGGRCLVAFAKQLGIIDKEASFDAVDGYHFASVENGLINLQMIDVETVELFDDHTFLNTGSPHHVSFSENIDEIDIKKQGSAIRYGAPYFSEGTNVNFVEQLSDNSFKVRTYERGVEDETLACGTGVTAVAIAAHRTGKTASNHVEIDVLGGALEVSFNTVGQKYTKVFLKGPAAFVYEGQISI